MLPLLKPTLVRFRVTTGDPVTVIFMVILILASFFSAAVMVAVPPELAVTVPLEVTDATEGLLLVQVKVSEVKRIPSDSISRVFVCPAFKESLDPWV